MQTTNPYADFLKELFKAAVDRVDPYSLVMDRFHYSPVDNCVTINPAIQRTTNNQEPPPPIRLCLDNFNRILVLGAGKASAPMAVALEDILANVPLELSGYISVKYDHGAPTKKIRIIEAGHPIPDSKSRQAAQEIISLLDSADSQTVIINLISGGASALLAAPSPGLSMQDIQEMTAVLLGSGASIHEINTLRKHCSAIKGGRMAERSHPAHLLNLILSDVVGDNLEVIASGLTVPDPSSFSDVWNIVDTYRLADKLPATIIKHFEQGLKDPSLETPKPQSPVFAHSQTVLIGNNRLALEAAAERARSKGVETLVLTSQLSGEASEVASVFAAIALDPPGRNLCIIAGGETTVTIRGRGKGGRNQELALAFLNKVLQSQSRKTSTEYLPPFHFLSAGSDGSDGPTDAAGAIITVEDIRRISQSSAKSTNPATTLDPAPYLADNNAYEYLSKTGLIFKTGPTRSNVCDFCFLYIPG